MAIKFDMLHRVLNKATQLSQTDAWKFAIDEDVKDEIIRLNTQEQMFDQGIDKDGNTLGDYSDVSVQIYGKPAGHIRLKDTGHFYDSFKIILDATGLTITADDTSIYDQPLTQIWGNEIIGLTIENLRSLKEWVLPNYLIYVKEQLLQ